MNGMEQTPPTIEPGPASATPARLSLAARLINLFATPAEVFDDVRNTPPTETNWLVPALIVMVLGWLGAAVIFSQDSIRFQMRDMAEKAIQKQIEKSHMSESQAEAVRQAGELMDLRETYRQRLGRNKGGEAKCDDERNSR